MELSHPRYVALIDEYVTSLVHDGNVNRLETLILRGYDHVTDLEVVRRRKAGGGEHKALRWSRQLEEVLPSLQNAHVSMSLGERRSTHTMLKSPCSFVERRSMHTMLMSLCSLVNAGEARTTCSSLYAPC